MKIDLMIKQLQEIQSIVGNVHVYFDCPDCKVSFTPDKIETSTVHIKGVNKTP